MTISMILMLSKVLTRASITVVDSLMSSTIALGESALQLQTLEI